MKTNRVLSILIMISAASQVACSGGGGGNNEALKNYCLFAQDHCMGMLAQSHPTLANAILNKNDGNVAAAISGLNGGTANTPSGTTLSNLLGGGSSATTSNGTTLAQLVGQNTGSTPVTGAMIQSKAAEVNAALKADSMNPESSFYEPPVNHNAAMAPASREPSSQPVVMAAPAPAPAPVADTSNAPTGGVATW